MPVFSNAPELLAKYGPSRIVILGAISFVIRGVGYVLAPNAYFVLLVEPLHGVTFATYKAAGVSFVASRTPERYTAIGQSMLTVVEELGRTVGTSFGGYVMKTFGSKTLYGGAAALVFAATMLFAWVSEQSGKGGSNSSEEQQCLSPENVTSNDSVRCGGKQEVTGGICVCHTKVSLTLYVRRQSSRADLLETTELKT